MQRDPPGPNSFGELVPGVGRCRAPLFTAHAVGDQDRFEAFEKRQRAGRAEALEDIVVEERDRVTSLTELGGTFLGTLSAFRGGGIAPARQKPFLT